MPQEIWDENITLSLCEFRLLGYLLRHQLRTKNEKVLVSQDELLHGRRRKDGSRIDQGCGIGNARNLIKARISLEERGWLHIHKGELHNSPLIYEALSRDIDEEDGSVETIPPGSVETIPKQLLFDTTSSVETTPVISKEVEELKKKVVEGTSLPSWVPSREFNNWVENRKALRKPLTPHARDLAIKDLEKLRTEGENLVEVINLAILKGWTSFYSAKGRYGTTRALTAADIAPYDPHKNDPSRKVLPRAGDTFSARGVR